MKAKLLKIFTVCLVTFVILSPEIAVFGLVWQQHLYLEKNNLIVHKNYLQNQQDILVHKSFLQDDSDRSFLFIVNKYKTIFILESLLICIPVGIGISVFAYEKYLIYRAEVYRKQVAILEKIWQRSNYR
jgi:ABC-type phosphate transport system permease subunit